MSEKKKKGYRDTLNLPKTSFSMKANLTQREPQQHKAWKKQKIYDTILAAREDAPTYTLHDGPPYANGDIHMGHVINKVLKDIVVKYKTMAGFKVPYIPGWDCHGLPIEVKVMQELGEKIREMPKLEIRKRCKKYASKFVKVQTKQFKSLGIFGDFDNPYLTLKPQYEQGILEIFAELIGNGLVYKQLKPIHWSVGCETALADAELEYKDIPSLSVYVNFPVTDETRKKLADLNLVTDDDATASFMIWTTTPWTLTANLAVAVNPKLDYVSMTYTKEGRKFSSIIAAERVEAVAQAAGLEQGDYTISDPVKGCEFEGLRYEHPFVETNPTDKDAYFAICADYVTTEDGTGVVHIAPGHGVEDYVAAQNYGLAVYSPVMDNGRYDNTVPAFIKGKSVLKVDPIVADHLSEKDLLVAAKEITHSYPHCWRSKTPVIFRATEQWFVSVDNQVPKAGKSLRNLALEQIGDVQWVPQWGEKRIRGMLESRPDWCISRQRAWGLPIPAFLNSDGDTLMTKESCLRVAEHIGKKGSDSWFIDSPKEILGEDFELPEGFTWDDLHKEENIFDVWFESGCSWHSVMRKRGYDVPVDLYLEGSDQHRGWFQLSLLPALGAIQQAPFKTVLTHGFTVDEKGMKQSKSLGNYVSALEEIQKYGADILRLWVSSVNYQEDMRCSDELIGRLSDAYRKIRNTLRYLLGNVKDYDRSMAVPYEKMLPVDKWAMQQLQKLISKVRLAYEDFAFHRVFGLVYNFCTVQMSSIYMDVLKDRLYCDKPDSISRRSAQTVMVEILEAMIKLISPVLVHTGEEAWAAFEQKSETDLPTVHAATLPDVNESINWQAEEARWDKIMTLRDDVLRVLEGLRQEQAIASNQEASVTITIDDEELYSTIEELGVDTFTSLCIVSEVKLEKGDKLDISAAKSDHPKCERCWNYLPSVGHDTDQPDLCIRCAEVVNHA
ncbi:Isoleucine--tRNA ligase [Anaerohalosphaera lusitana]|uniref:Isoleucine--tRNA ligase n=1 Tax=Anaerohalosphaera lusitana TaxID=1936003 RepID=A0A1U9NJ95_9BACT|nr:isoleucine--tRNA ligase [Anaerohalosphaera lusitana]AQT67999.1 Isoleucine--tRNA ligase [Anaerohalosphaera lusitana]